MKILLLILLLTFTVFAQQSIKFDAALAQNVNHGQFWEVYSPGNPKTLEADFAWEAWVKIAPELTSGYVVSSGYGGAHAILFGFTNDGTTKYRLTGNFRALPSGVCDASETTIQFGSSYVFEPDVWYHVAVASVNHQLTGYQNGQPVFTRSWQGKRISSTCAVLDTSAGGLYVGGSSHSNFSGSISQVRGWEGFSPYTGNAFIPETTFSSYWIREDKSRVDSVFLASYQQRKMWIEDLSNGYKKTKHNGSLHPTLRRAFWRNR